MAVTSLRGLETKDGQGLDLAVVENGTLRCKLTSYFDAVGSGTGVSASVCR